jgi:hypothetical protein
VDREYTACRVERSHLSTQILHEANVTNAIDRYSTVNARPFDPNWITGAPSLGTYLGNLCIKLTKAEKRERRRYQAAQANYEAAVKAIVLDLFRAHESDPNLEVGIGSGTTTLQKLSKSRYGASFISARTFQDALGILISQGLVTISMSTPGLAPRQTFCCETLKIIRPLAIRPALRRWLRVGLLAKNARLRR